MVLPFKNKRILVVLLTVVAGGLIYYLATNVRVQNIVTYIEPVSPSNTLGYEGTITELDVIKSPKIKLSFKLRVSENGFIDPEIFFFDDDELKYVKVQDATGKEISYTELKVGQKISFTQKSKLMIKPYFRTQIKIL